VANPDKLGTTHVDSAAGGGGLTDAELRATPVPVSGTVSVTEPVTVDAVDLDIRNLTFATDKADISGSTGVGVTGTFFQATQPVSAVTLPLPTGAATLAAQTQPGVDIGDVTINNAAGAAAVNIQDGGNTITVDGTVSTIAGKSATATLSNVASSTTNVTLLASNANRNAATIFNDSTKILFVKYGATASATSFTVKMLAGSYHEVFGNYTGIIDGIWANANGSARITELTT